MGGVSTLAPKDRVDSRQSHFFLVISGQGSAKQASEGPSIVASDDPSATPSREDRDAVREQLIRELREFGC